MNIKIVNGIFIVFLLITCIVYFLDKVYLASFYHGVSISTGLTAPFIISIHAANQYNFRNSNKGIGLVICAFLPFAFVIIVSCCYFGTYRCPNTLIEQSYKHLENAQMKQVGYNIIVLTAAMSFIVTRLIEKFVLRPIKIRVNP